MKQSRLPQAALSPTFRRITRPRGPVIRRAAPESDGQPSDLLVRLNEGEITAAPPKAPPEGQISLTEIADDLVPDWVPGWLRLPLIRRIARLLLLLLLRLVSLLRLGGRISRFLRNLLNVLDAIPASARLKEGRLTPGAVDRVPPRPQFVVTEPGDGLPPDIDRAGDHDSPEGANLRTALRDLHERLQTPLLEPPERPPLDLSNAGRKLVQALDPVYVMPKRVRTIVALPHTFNYLRPVETIVPVMAHPVFADPMYKPLRDISSELLIPNLQLIPNNAITLLETNPKFIEAYMVGLNHEMARELLWGEYDTDQRCSPFRQFWDVADTVDRADADPKALEEARRDITALHEWDRSTPLGTHENRPLPGGGDADESRLVLVIRGDLLKKYPTSVIYAQKARWVDDPEHPRKIRVVDERDPAQSRLEPIFKSGIEPDVRFLGFNLTASEAKGDTTPPPEGEEGTPGYFFVIQERPGEPRFGLDIKDITPPTPTSWNELAWNHLGDPEIIELIDLTTVPATNITASPDSDIAWGSNAADMAYILYQVPVMVAVHAADMLR